MARVMGIHGIAQQFKGANTLAAVWFPALLDGMIAGGGRAKAATLSADDVAVSFYGDLFRPKTGLGAEYPPYRPKDLTSADERALLESFYDAACVEDPGLAAPNGALGPGRDALRKLGQYPPVQVMLERILRSRTFGNSIPERAFIGDLKQVALFLNDAVVKAKGLGCTRPFPRTPWS